MKKTLALALMLSALPLASSFAAGPPAAPALPAPKLLVLDRAAILGASKVGQDVTRQIQAIGRSAKADLDARNRALEAQAQTLQQQVAILAPDVKAAKIKDFEAKQAALQTDAQRKEQSIQYSAMVANSTIAKALDPILTQLMQERGANMILDKQAVLMGTNLAAFDITGEAINRLNQKMPALKVNLVSPPAR